MMFQSVMIATQCAPVEGHWANAVNHLPRREPFSSHANHDDAAVLGVCKPCYRLGN